MTGLPGKSAWTLAPGLAYLNHGSFGATPAVVLAEQQRLRAAMEANPVGFLAGQLPGLIDAVRAEVAAFLHADPDGVVFVDNATSGTQTVIAQAELRPGDEVLITDHVYPAVLAQLERAVKAAGAVLATVAVPLDVPGQGAVAAAVLAGLTARTRLVVVDHIASCSGMIFPVEEIAAGCRARGVPLLVDGAHATGMLPVDLTALGADFWVGNLHKWVSAPKASAVLAVGPRWRDTLRPLVASHGLADGCRPAFDWTGTRDPTALLSVPAALAFYGAVGWEAVRQHNRDLSRAGADLVSKRLRTWSPDAPGLWSAMTVVALPGPPSEEDGRALQAALEERGIIIPVTVHAGQHYVRLSAQLYNALADYERLGDALADLTAGWPATGARG